ncbi:hypothetical protein TNCV_1983821 [Trichonephila clavipes]|nr:hypothetical protein TNCV_1983821 [Trichonephila clavipes]
MERSYLFSGSLVARTYDVSNEEKFRFHRSHLFAELDITPLLLRKDSTSGNRDACEGFFNFGKRLKSQRPMSNGYGEDVPRPLPIYRLIILVTLCVQIR